MGEDKISLGFVVGLDYRDAPLLGPRRATAAQGPPAGRQADRGRQAGRLGRQDHSRPAATGRCPRSSGLRAWLLVGDGAGMVQRAELKGIHYAMHAGMYAAESIFERLKAGQHRGPLELRRQVDDSEIDEDTLPLAQHAPAVAKRLLRRQRAREHDGDLGRPLPRRPRATHDDADRRRLRRHGTRLPEARRQEDLRQAVLGLRYRATRPATTRRTTSASRRRCRSRSR